MRSAAAALAVRESGGCAPKMPTAVTIQYAKRNRTRRRAVLVGLPVERLDVALQRLLGAATLGDELPKPEALGLLLLAPQPGRLGRRLSFELEPLLLGHDGGRVECLAHEHDIVRLHPRERFGIDAGPVELG